MDEIKNLINDNDFMIKLAEVQTPDELVKVLAEKNIALEDGMTKEEAFNLVKEQENTEEIDEASLEDVSGGTIGLGLALTSAGLLIAGAGALCFLGGCAYATYRRWRKK